MEFQYTTKNEPVREYRPNSKEKQSLLDEYHRIANQIIEIPIIIGGKDVKTGNINKCVMPHNHKHTLANYHLAEKEEVNKAIHNSLESWKSWSKSSLDYRTKIFRKAAELLRGKWRNTINAATMLNQSKNAFQAEIDSACELIDFFNFNAEYAEKLNKYQPLISPKGVKNYLEYRPLEGFVFAITPFNFTSIAGNLPCAPALMGNVSIWKPASSAVLPCYYIMRLLQEAGLPDGVINFLPGSGGKVGDPVLKNPNLAGVHFTGSTETFQYIWKTIGSQIEKYKTYPRIVGETGGKDFCLAHESADIDELTTAMIRGAFEYQGQKCSAMSRAYLPKSKWDEIHEKLISEIKTIDVGPPEDFKNFVNAVIDETAFDKISSYLDYAKTSNDCEILCGGGYDKSKGYFVEPTVILAKDPHFKTLEEEIFGPVLTIFVYENENWNETLELIDNTSPYALTGCVFSEDRDIVDEVRSKLRFSAGNFYINDKPTGAVVGQQPFGGSRASGTNDKGGSMLNLLRWTSPRTIKETFEPPQNYKYPYMDDE